MSTIEQKPTPQGSRPALLLAEYTKPEQALRAAMALRDAGYKHFDAHTPYPIHGMDKAMGLSDSKVGWFVIIAGITGLVSAFSMMYWMNGVDYPLIIGGKPPKSIPSMIPIMFELTVLFSAFGALLGMFHLNRLPRHHHPVFNSERFGKFSDATFFISVENTDPQFSLERTKQLLDKTTPTAVEVVYDEAP